MFYFVIKYLSPLARIPGLPWIFDSMLLAGTAVWRRSRLAAIEKLEVEVLAWEGTRLRPHKFGGIEFVTSSGRQLGHVHGNGLLDVPLARAVALPLLAQGRVRPHHVLPQSGWVSLQLENCSDVPFALELLSKSRVG